MRLTAPVFIALFSITIGFTSCNKKKAVAGPQYFTTKDSVNIMFVEMGDPGLPPIIMLQGSDGTSLEWQVFSEKLKDKYHIILFDRRGNGLSSRLLPESKLNMELYLSDISELMDKLDLKKCTLLGWSFGGALAAEYALKFPDKLVSLILVNPLSDTRQLWLDRAEAIYPYAEGEKDSLTLKTIEKLQQGNHLSIDDEYQLVKEQRVTWFNILNADSFYKRVDMKKYGYDEKTISTDRENLIAQKKIYDNYSNLDRIHQVMCPTLIIGATHDHIITPKQCEKIHALIPRSEIKIIKNCGHLPFIERPNELEDILVDFIRR